MNHVKEEFQARLEKNRIEFVDDFPNRLNGIERLWDAYIHTQEDTLQKLLRHIHSLMGSAMTYNLPDISNLTSTLYKSVSNILINEQSPDVEQNEHITELFTQLKQARLDSQFNFEQPIIRHIESSLRIQENPSLLIAMNTREDTDDLIDQLQHYGYNIVKLDPNESLSSKVHESNPFVIVTDALSQLPLTFTENERELKNSTPIIFLSETDNIHARLQSVRMGCSNFLSKPIQTPELIEMLDHINQTRYEKPNRIMIIEDTKTLASLYEFTLKSRGMNTCVITDPMQALEKLEEFNPDLILIDMYMPSCNGQELAAIIRQHEAYVSIPIVYLSSELDTDKQLTAMSHGGDDFLTKPIDPEHLIKSIETRTSRYRTLRSLMVRDSLTGLYNHTKTKELLEKDLYRCARNNTNLIYAMLDIDNFKTVNDTYGHPIGDKVIKSLARLLKQRLRKSDTIGRYGGEEFAIVLYDTDINNAFKVINKIREHFSLLTHNAGDVEFNVTFSCGLAAYPYFDTVAELNEAADKALYHAKQTGRNKTIIADFTLV